MMLNKFWQCVAENMSVHMDAHILEWLGYDSEKERDNKASFIKLWEMEILFVNQRIVYVL